MEHLNNTGTLIANRRLVPPHPGPLPWGLSLPTSRVCNFANPEGILQQSPGLRGTSNPGVVALGEPTPTGLCPWVPERSHNPVGVERQFAREPRVARRLATLGWRAQSLWDCPKCQSELWVMLSPEEERGKGSPSAGEGASGGADAVRLRVVGRCLSPHPDL